MNRYWIVDSSPIILLSKIGKVALLHELSDELVIPAGVAQEIQQGAKNDVARRWLENDGTTWVQETSIIIPKISAWLLGLGESQVLCTNTS
jgi:predicted nucleic acid-binding protein